MAVTKEELTTIKVQKEGGVAVVSFNRPDARNALNEEMRLELGAVLREFEQDRAVRAILVRGEGPHFCSGADINELERRTALSTAWYPGRIDKVVESMSKPVIGELRGYTLGGGFELSLCFTLRVASESLRCGFPEVRLGVFPGLGGTQRLPRMVGEAKALELMLTGGILEAEEALQLGLVSRLYPDSELSGKALELASQLAAGPPIATACILEGVRRSSDLGRSEGLDYERKLFALVCESRDKSEGIQAWKEKRQPKFTGE